MPPMIVTVGGSVGVVDMVSGMVMTIRHHPYLMLAENVVEPGAEEAKEARVD